MSDQGWQRGQLVNCAELGRFDASLVSSARLATAQVYCDLSIGMERYCNTLKENLFGPRYTVD